MSIEQEIWRGMQDILIELRAIRRLLENDGHRPGAEAIGKPLTPTLEGGAAAERMQRVSRNFVSVRARALRGS